MVANTFNEILPEATNVQSNSFEMTEQIWPSIAGEYYVLSHSSPIAISTLTSEQLAERICKEKPEGVCIVGKLETENIGIEKIIKNTITNPNIRFLLLCGLESTGHYSGQTMLSLIKNGIDNKMRVVESPGKKPILSNTSHEEVNLFRQQVQVVNMIGCEDTGKIIQKIRSIYNNIKTDCTKKSNYRIPSIKVNSIKVVKAKDIKPESIKLDKAGYFVIIPIKENNAITIEHYSYKNQLLRLIEGYDARSIYLTIIENGWVSDLGHAAYLGKELTKAELSMKLGFKYVQDGA